MKRIIDISVSVTNDPAAHLFCVDAKVEREREKGDAFNIREYENISFESLLRLQKAQQSLIDKDRS